MTSIMRRARVQGVLLLVAAFALGIAVGVVAARRSRPVPQMLLTATDRMPDEIARLDLSPDQRQQIRSVLRRGADRMFGVIREFDPRVQAAVDSTDAEIRALLTSAQIARLDSSRRARGPLLRQQRVGGPPGEAQAPR